jgi:hypothetical protein
VDTANFFELQPYGRDPKLAVNTVVVQGISGCTQSDGHLEEDAQKVMISPKKI